MNRNRRALAGLALIALIALISGCGSSAPAQTDSGSGGGNNSAASAQKAVKFAECMGRNGVSKFPDPNASNRFTIGGGANGSSLDTSTPGFKRASSSCKDLEPAGFMGSKRSPEQQSAALWFAKCIRANGVRDFPDPTPDGPLVDTNRIPSANSPGGMSILNVAMHKCRDAASAAGAQR